MGPFWSPYPNSHIIISGKADDKLHLPSVVGWCWTVHHRSTSINGQPVQKLRIAAQGWSPDPATRAEQNKSGKYRITKTTRKKPSKQSKADGRTSSDDSMTGQRELGKTTRTVGPEMRRLCAFKPLVVSTYNVRTLYQQGKSHQLFMGCSDAGTDIIGIQEHRLITTNPTEELRSDDKNWVLVYSSATDQRQGGVGIMMSKHIYKCLQSVKSITKRIISATFHGNPQLTVTSIYAPTECASPEDKNDFYNDLYRESLGTGKNTQHSLSGRRFQC